VKNAEGKMKSVRFKVVKCRMKGEKHCPGLEIRGTSTNHIVLGHFTYNLHLTFFTLQLVVFIKLISKRSEYMI